MDITKLIINTTALIFFSHSFADNTTTTISSTAPNYEETQNTSDINEQFTAEPDSSVKVEQEFTSQSESITSSASVSYSYFSTRYTDSALDEHALRVSANCQPLNTEGSKGVAVVPLDDSFYVIPTKPSSLPPYPAGGGTQGIHGIDVNQNCVRDDIEHFIFKEYGAADQEQLREYLYEYVIWLNFYLIGNISEQTIQAVSRQNAKTGLCLDDVMGFSNATIIKDSIFGQVHNTELRTYRFFENTKVLSGWLIEDSIQPSC